MTERAPHILILSSWYPTEERPFLGNFVERHAQLLGSEYHVTVIALECKNNISRNEITTESKENITEIRASYPKGSRISRFANRYRVFSDALKSIDTVDLIIGHVLLPHGWMFLNASRDMRCPWIWVEHGSYFRKDIYRRWSAKEKLLRRRAIPSAAEIVAVSDTLKEELKRFVWPKNIEVIGNHVDGELFSFQPKNNEGKTKFLHVSTLDESTKNVKGIFDACALLKDNGHSFELTVVSDEDYTRWNEYVHEKKLSDFIKFKGPLNWEELPEFYHKADAFILNSNYETFSIVIAEALSTGTPVISTPVGIVPQLPDECVLKVEKESPESLMHAMLQIMSGERSFDHEAISKIGERFHSGKILSQWSDLINRHVG